MGNVLSRISGAGLGFVGSMIVETGEGVDRLRKSRSQYHMIEGTDLVLMKTCGSRMGVLVVAHPSYGTF